MTKTESKPEANAPQSQPLMVKTVVSVKATVPLLQYGNIEMFVSQEFYSPAADPEIVRETTTAAYLLKLREHLAYQILPLAEAEVERAQLNPEFAKANNKDGWMQRNNPTYRWLRVAAPDLTVTAMQEILANTDIALH